MTGKELEVIVNFTIEDSLTYREVVRLQRIIFEAMGKKFKMKGKYSN